MSDISSMSGIVENVDALLESYVDRDENPAAYDATREFVVGQINAHNEAFAEVAPLSGYNAPMVAYYTCYVHHVHDV